MSHLFGPLGQRFAVLSIGIFLTALGMAYR